MADALIELRRIEEVTVLTLSAGKANAFDRPLLEALGGLGKGSPAMRGESS